MEQHFFRDGFEHYLRDSVDNFRIYPTRKVWNSIYNNMHPGRRWPSLSVLLMLIFALIYIGINHSQHLSKPDVTNTGSYSLQANTNPAPAGFTKLISANGNINQNSPAQTGNANINNTTKSQPAAGSSLHKIKIHTGTSQQVTQTALIQTTVQAEPTDPASASHGKMRSETEPANTQLVLSPGIHFTGMDASDSKTSIIILSPDPVINPEEMMLMALRNADIANRKNIDEIDLNNPQNISEKEWMEDFAFHNKPRLKKWKTNVDYSAYVTPSMGYRSFKANMHYDASARISAISPLSNAYSNNPEVDQYPAVNYEAGAAARYHYNRNLLLKFGVQFNYENYLVMATRLNHSTATTLLLNNQNSGTPYLVSKSSNLSNINGLAATSINNNSFQVSVPIGVDFRLAGNQKIEWFAGATLQPGYVFGGQSLLISSDHKYYINDNSLRRKWNLNTGIESYLTYKTNAGISLLAGPQFRYQVFSSYSNQYSYKENLYNIGMKIGVIKKF